VIAAAKRHLEVLKLLARVTPDRDQVNAAFLAIAKSGQSEGKQMPFEMMSFFLGLPGIDVNYLSDGTSVLL
jgi:hypothetical protein